MSFEKVGSICKSRSKKSLILFVEDEFVGFILIDSMSNLLRGDWKQVPIYRNPDMLYD